VERYKQQRCWRRRHESWSRSWKCAADMSYTSYKVKLSSCPNTTPPRSWTWSFKYAADMSLTSYEVKSSLCLNTTPTSSTRS
jgi:hypothetical protein